MICTVKIINWRQDHFYYNEESEHRPRKIPFIRDLRDALYSVPNLSDGPPGSVASLRYCKNICDEFFATGDGSYPTAFQFDCKYPERYASFLKGLFLGNNFDIRITYTQEVEL